MGKLFGTNGVRGIFSEDFNLEFIHDLTLSISTYFQRGTILVGYDGRHSSPVISKIVCSTLNFAGLDCHIAGLVPTPCLEFATKNLGYDGGIMITASHNPSEYNGIKPVASDGVEISREDEEVIEGIFFKKNWKFDSSVYGTTKNDSAAVQTYIDGIKSQVNISKIKSRKFKVVLDIGNGAQAVIAVKLCEQLGCEIITINEQIDGNFPGRGSEPLPSNLHELSSAVVKNGADFGIAFDGDGDRSILCDNEGKLLTGDMSALLLSNYLLSKNPNSKVITAINSGNWIDEIVSQTNSTVIRTKVGSVEISRKSSFTTKDKISCTEEGANNVVSGLLAEFPGSDTTDGIKIILDNKNWVMIRPSGTEPIIRIYAESDSQKNLESLMEKFIQKIKSIISSQHF